MNEEDIKWRSCGKCGEKSIPRGVDWRWWHNGHCVCAMCAMDLGLLETPPEFREMIAAAISSQRRQTLHEQVLAFHKRFGQSIGETPHVPDEKTLRFRLSLVAEEFFEMLDAVLSYPHFDEAVFEPVQRAIKNSALSTDLPALVDALADLDYVIEGFRITMGVDGAPIAAEVQRANMAKLPSYVAAKDATHGKVNRLDSFSRVDHKDTSVIRCRCGASFTWESFDPGLDPFVDEHFAHNAAPVKRADGKIMKPLGWVAPDITGELKKQGWEP